MTNTIVLVCCWIAGTMMLADAVSASDKGNSMVLKLVSVVFRHGDRAPDPTEMFPSDPHYENSFYPEGLGGLTNAGKRRIYDLGALLRERYNDLLGDEYLPESVVARSTDYKRTKMCLQLVLASLYPPLGPSQTWNPRLNWQPIPASYVSSDRDWLMIPEECPEYLAERDRIEREPKIQNKIASFQNLMDRLTSLTGKDVSKPVDMYNLYHILTAEAAMNLTLPSWTKDIFPSGELLDGTNLEYEIFSYNELLRRLNGGKLLYRIMKDMKSATAGTLPKERRIALFSGHETNVAAVLQALDVYEPHVPEYASAVLFELYATNDKQYYVKILYNLGIPTKLVVKTIPGCEELCPLKKFMYLLRDVVPTHSELNCVKHKK